MSTYSLQEEAVFGAGSFWNAEDVFSRVHGVIATKVGYAGGTSGHPTFHELADHVEAVHVLYDQRVISYEELVEVFWKIYDSESDHKERYAPCIFYVTDEQRSIAKKSVKSRHERTDKPVKVTIEPLGRFWEAEEYHQHYLAKMRGER